jgi:hypothetical protein
MLTAAQAKFIADSWIQAWNSHDVERIMAFYASNASVISPAVVKLLNEPTGTVTGTAALRAFFKRGVEAYSYLQFQLIEVMFGVASVVVYYANHRGTRTCELLELDAAGKIVRSISNYSG